jgi:hypothetical protein
MPPPPLSPLSLIAVHHYISRKADIKPALLTISPVPKHQTPPTQQAPRLKSINPMNLISYASSSSQPLHLAAPSLQPTQHPLSSSLPQQHPNHSIMLLIKRLSHLPAPRRSSPSSHTYLLELAEQPTLHRPRQLRLRKSTDASGDPCL